MFASAWTLLKDSVTGFIEDEALRHGAAMAFYAVTSLAPILLIVIAIAGLAFGQQAAQNAIAEQMTGLMGQQSAEMLQNAIKGASGKSSGVIATVIGVVTLLVTASGVFGEMQSALNAIWKTKSTAGTASRLIRARAASLGLVAALGFLLMVSLVISAGISAIGDIINAHLPFGKLILNALNAVISFLLISVLFAAIYKLLPDRHLEWRDVMVGAVATAALFTVGKSLIGLYLGSSAVASTYGAAGSLLIVLLWVYYSSEIFLLGAEFTRAYSLRHGSHRNVPDTELQAPPSDAREVGSRRSGGTKAGAASTPRPRAADSGIAASPGFTVIAIATVVLAFIRQWRGHRS